MFNLLTIITAHEGGENVVVDAADMAGNASAAAGHNNTGAVLGVVLLGWALVTAGKKYT